MADGCPRPLGRGLQAAQNQPYSRAVNPGRRQSAVLYLRIIGISCSSLHEANRFKSTAEVRRIASITAPHSAQLIQQAQTILQFLGAEGLLQEPRKPDRCQVMQPQAQQHMLAQHPAKQAIPQ